MIRAKDVVLIHLEGEPVSYARVESILPDSKKDWYHIKLLMLQIPAREVTWILKGEYINGQEFTMGGKKMELREVKGPSGDQDLQENSGTPGGKEAEIISFNDFKKHQ